MFCFVFWQKKLEQFYFHNAHTDRHIEKKKHKTQNFDIKINSKWIIAIIKKHDEDRKKSFNGLGKRFLDSQMYKPLKKLYQH